MPVTVSDHHTDSQVLSELFVITLSTIITAIRHYDQLLLYRNDPGSDYYCIYPLTLLWFLPHDLDSGGWGYTNQTWNHQIFSPNRPQ